MPLSPGAFLLVRLETVKETLSVFVVIVSKTCEFRVLNELRHSFSKELVVTSYKLAATEWKNNLITQKQINFFLFRNL